MKSNQNTSKDFSLSEGGPFNSLLLRTGLHDNPSKLIIVSFCIAGLPLIIITALEGTLYSGVQFPFLIDYSMHVRILLGIPMLLLIRFAINRKVREVVSYLSEALLSPQESRLLVETVFQRAKKLTNSALAEMILLLLVVIATASIVKSGVSIGFGKSSTWMISPLGNHALSIAGYWAVFISIPIFQFLIIRWLWRYLVWVMLLFRLSKAKLQLLPTHPDRSGGLGVLILAQRSFNLIFVVGSIVISGELTAELIDAPDTFNAIKGIMIAYIVMSLVFILIPMLFFIGQLFQIKNEGLLKMSNLGATLSRKFEREWVNDSPIEKRIEEQQVDPSMLYDYSGLYESLQKLRTIPVIPQDIIGLVILLFVPFVPLFIIHYSVAELIQTLARMLI